MPFSVILPIHVYSFAEKMHQSALVKEKTKICTQHNQAQLLKLALAM